MLVFWTMAANWPSQNPVPTITGIPGPYRYHFYSFDCAEPAHVHVRRDASECKIWLDQVRLAYSHGFAEAELRAIKRAILQNRHLIMEAWDEHCRPATE